MDSNDEDAFLDELEASLENHKAEHSTDDGCTKMSDFFWWMAAAISIVFVVLFFHRSS